jgi:hypothetical protein
MRLMLYAIVARPISTLARDNPRIRADTSIRGPTPPTSALSRVQAKDRDGNRQLEVVPGSGEGERGGLCLVRAKPIAHPEANRQHDEKVGHTDLMQGLHVLTC